MLLELGKWTSRWADNTFKQAEGRKTDIVFICKRSWKCKFPCMFSTSPKKRHQWFYMDFLGVYSSNNEGAKEETCSFNWLLIEVTGISLGTGWRF